MMDGFGPIGSLPAHTRLAEIKSPDRCPSFSIAEHVGRGKDIVGIYEIKDDRGIRLGALVISARGVDGGRLLAHGVCLFTNDEITK